MSLIRLFRFELTRLCRRDIALLIALIFLVALLFAAIASFVRSLAFSNSESELVNRELRRPPTEMEETISNCRTSNIDAFHRVVEEYKRTSKARGIPENQQRRQIEAFRKELDRFKTRRECLRELRPSADKAAFVLGEGGLPVGDVRFVFADSFLRGVSILALPGALAAIVLASSYVGAEWSSGSVTTVLTWEPRRLRLFSVKFLVLIIVVTGGFILLEGLTAVSMLPTGLVKGTFVGLDQWWWEELVDLSWRGALTAVLAAVLGGSLAFIFRSTVAAVGGLAGYLIIVESVLRAVTRELRGWLITNNVFEALSVGNERVIAGRSPEEALGLLTAYALSLLLLAGFLFWRRDVATQTP